MMLDAITIVSLAINVPGPAATARLRKLGAKIIKVEPPGGDPLKDYCPAWYRELAEGCEIIPLDLKNESDRDRFNELLKRSDLLVTSMRLAALKRLSLGWSQVRERFPHLSQIAVLGCRSPLEEIAGHDLTYQAKLGLIRAPHLPNTLLADLVAAERIVSTALEIFLKRERKKDGEGFYAEVSIAESVEIFAAPLRYGLTAPEGLLGGGYAGYNLYETARGWIAVAALEPHFWRRLLDELKAENVSREQLKQIFLTKTAEEWELWSASKDIPIVAVKDCFETEC